MRLYCPRLLNLIAIAALGFAPSANAQKGGASPAQSQPASQAGGGATPYFETEMLAYGAANQLSAAIAQKICNARPQIVPANATVIIFDQQSFQNLAAWQSFVAGTQALKDAYNTLDPDANFNAMGGFLLGGADLGSLITAIAASTSNTASTFTIQDSSMAVSLMHQMQRLNCNVRLVYYPLFGSYADLDSATSLVKNTLMVLNTARQDIQNNVICRTDPATLQQSCVAATDPRGAAFADLNSQYDMLLKDFLTLPGQSAGGPGGGGQNSPPNGAQNTGSPNSASPSSGSSGAISLVQGAELQQLTKKDDTYILYADVVAAGGTQRDVKNLFTLFTGDWLSYSGGLIVNVALVKSKETRLEFSDTLRYRTDFHHRDLWDVLGFKSFTSPRSSDLVEKVNSGSNELSLCDDGRRSVGFSYHPLNDCAVARDEVVPQSLRLSQHEVIGGTQVNVTVELPERAKSDRDIQLFSSDQNLLVGSATVKRGAKLGTFTMTTPIEEVKTPIAISFIDDAKNIQSTVITVDPAPLAFEPSVVSAGSMCQGTLILNIPDVPPQDILLRSSDSHITLDAPMTQALGAETKATFNINTANVTASTVVVISAIYKNTVESAKLTITK